MIDCHVMAPSVIGIPIISKCFSDSENLYPIAMARVKERSEFGERLKMAREHAPRGPSGRPMSQGALAKAAGTSQANIAGLEKEGQGTPFVVEIARVCGVSARWLSTGEGLMTDADSYKGELSRSDKSNGIASQVEVSPELDGPKPIIPTDMPFSNHNLAQTFRLLGNIIGALPAEKRSLLKGYVGDLVEDPEASNYIAKQAVKRLGVPDQVSGNAQLNRWLAGDLEISVETRPASLGSK